jgi:hypothetical protein
LREKVGWTDWILTPAATVQLAAGTFDLAVLE